MEEYYKASETELGTRITTVSEVATPLTVLKSEQSSLRARLDSIPAKTAGEKAQAESFYRNQLKVIDANAEEEKSGIEAVLAVVEAKIIEAEKLGIVENADTLPI